MNSRANSDERLRRKGEGGFTYISLLVLIAIMGISLSAAGEVWHMTMKREREQELLFVGGQFRAALTMYYNAPVQGGRYPTSLEDLLKDPRYPVTRRYLRKIFADPITNGTDWGLVKGASGEIVGVYSKSDEEPAKKHNFSVMDKVFEDKKKYSDWVFMMPITTGLTPQAVPGNIPANGPAPGVVKPSDAPIRRMNP